MAEKAEALISHFHHKETSSWVEVVGFIIFIMCLSNTCTIISTLCVKRFYTFLNIHLLSLAFADIVIGNICMPFTIYEQMGVYEYNSAMCKILPYLQGVSVLAEIWTRVVISVERYYAIVHPLRARRRQRKPRAYKIIMLLWILSLVVNIPIILVANLYKKEDEEEVYQCQVVWPNNWWERAIVMLQSLFWFIIPISIVIVTHYKIFRRLNKCFRVKKNNFEMNTVASPEVVTTSFEQDDTESDTSRASLSVIGLADQMTDQNTANRPRQSFSIGLRSTHVAQNIATKNKISVSLTVIIVEFFVLWMPGHILNLVILNENASGTVLDRLLLVAQFMGYLSTCFNPIIYYFINEKCIEFVVQNTH